MAQNGNQTSIYLQKELEEKIDEVVKLYPGTFKSRNHFINCAASRELRRLESVKPDIETE